jgi:apolipoprotein N-acyltransferase
VCLGTSVAASVIAQAIPGAAWLALAAPGPLLYLLCSSGLLSSCLLIGAFNILTAMAFSFWIRQAEGGVLSLAAVAGLGALLAAIPTAGIWLGGNRPARRLALVAPCWMLMDRIASLTPLDYLWSGLGTPLADWPAVAQTASLAGPETLSLLVTGCGAALALLARGSPLPALTLGPAWLAIALTFGYWRLPQALDEGSKVALVQPSIPQSAGWDQPESRARLLEDLRLLIDRAAAEQPALTVLPEAALPGLVRFDEELTGFARSAVERSGRPLLFGSIDRDESGNLYNAAFLISPDGGVSVYRKESLAPWVESRFAKGARTLFPFRLAATLAPVLWAEDASADRLREAGAAGADLAVAMINTEAFASSAETLMHRRKAQLAAVAAGMPLLRAGNHAGTCAVDAFGRVSHELEAGRRGMAVARASVGRVDTWFGTLGGWAAPGLAGVWITGSGLCLLLAKRKSLRRSRRRHAH